MVDTGESGIDVGDVIGAISSSPSGGQTVVTIADTADQIEFRWGFGLGALLLLLSALILVISGVLEYMANTEFFSVKNDEKPMADKPEKSKEKNDKEKKEE